MHKVDISSYTSFFHDGEVINIDHQKNNIVFFIRSAEIDSSIVKDIILSKDNVIKGKLHLEGVKLILENGVRFNGTVKMKLSDNDLLHLKIKSNVLFCEIGWRGSVPFQNDFSALEIHAQKIWWENIPGV